MSDKEILDICQRLTAIETKLDAIIDWQAKAPCAAHERFVDRAKFMLAGISALGGAVAVLTIEVVKRWMAKQ